MVNWLLIIVGSLVGLWLLLEIVLRWADVSYPGLYETDEHTAVTLRPKAKGWYHKENPTYVRINSHGLRDRERSHNKPPGVLRIALLGNSFCEALQVPVEKTVGAELERLLNQCPAAAGREVEVINFGVA